MSIVLLGISFAIAFVISLVILGSLSDGEKRASKPVLKGALTGIAVAAAQFFLLVAGSRGEGALLAPMVGVVLIPAPLLGGVVAGLLYGSRNRSRWIAAVCMVLGGFLLLHGILVTLFSGMIYVPGLLTGAVLFAGGYWLRKNRKERRITSDSG